MDLNDGLRLGLITAMVGSLVSLWRYPRDIRCFALYVLLSIVQGVNVLTIDGRQEWISQWIPLETCIVALAVLATLESFGWALFAFTDAAKKPFMMALLGAAVAMAALFRPAWTIKDVLDLFLMIRVMVYASLFGTLLIGSWYVIWQAELIERFSAIHALLLAGLMGAHTIIGPLCKYVQVSVEHVYLPMGIVLFIGWSWALQRFRAPNLNLPRVRFFFETSPGAPAASHGRAR